MLRIISILIFVLFIVLLPPAALAYVSQDAIPGDSLYPVKRKLEDIILNIATINPTSKAWFALAYTKRRYEETTSLIDKKDNTAASLTLKQLVSQTQSVAIEINQVNDQSQKAQLKEQLKTNITQYQQGLDAAKTQLTQNSSSTRQPNPSPSAQASTPSDNQTHTTAPSPTPNIGSGEGAVSDDDLAKQLEDAGKQLGTIGNSTGASAPAVPPSTDDSDLEAALLGLDGIDVAGFIGILAEQNGKLISLVSP